MAGHAGLLAYQKALVVFQGTVRFCGRFLGKRDRTVDQMIQAARSGKQNIVEGSKVSGTSKEAEIKLINVARASLEELLEDYRDFLRVRKLGLWPKDSREALFVRKLGAQEDVSYKTYETYIETRSPEIVANILICLIHQTNYLLDQLIRKLQKAFVEEGGLRERMTRARLAERAKQKSHLTASAVRDCRSLKSSSRYYCTDIVHSSRAKEKFRGFTPLPSADSGG
jgi:four helix bundle suffix protein